jgi:hypothetical protein
MASNQEKLNDLWWILCAPDGREFLKGIMKEAAREVALEAGVLDAQNLSLLKRDCNLVDPTGKSGEVVGTTTLAKKINWMAHNDAQLLNAIVEVSKKLDVTHPTIPAESTVNAIEEGK